MMILQRHVRLMFSFCFALTTLLIYVLIIVVFNPLNMIFKITKKNVGAEWIFFTESISRYLEERGWL